MRYGVVSGTATARKTDAFIVPVYEGEKASDELKDIDAMTGGLLAKVLGSGEFEPKANKTALLHTDGDRILLVGGGKRKEQDLDKAIQMFGTAVRALPSVCTNATVFVRGDLAPELQ